MFFSLLFDKPYEISNVLWLCFFSHMSHAFDQSNFILQWEDWLKSGHYAILKQCWGQVICYAHIWNLTIVYVIDL